MSEDNENEFNYKDGDIVWVKISSYWWPAEVKDKSNVPADAYNFKKPPLVTVKFFNEDAYEFIKSYANIFPYSCDRKNEFIKKGMHAFRANNPHMEKFPIDVSDAEVKTNGNPNILSDPMFLPQKRSSLIAELFGSPTKKSPKDSLRRSKGRPSTSKNSSQNQKLHITHRRFLGYDDYEAIVREQYPGKDGENYSDDEEIRRFDAEPTDQYCCSSCPFKTIRLEVMLFHVKCHIQGICMTPAITTKAKSPRKSAKKPKMSTKLMLSSDDEDSVLGYSNKTNNTGTSDEEFKLDKKVKSKRKRKLQTTPRKPKKNRNSDNSEVKTTTHIRTNLLAEWDDDSDMSDDDMNNSFTKSSDESKSQVTDKTTTNDKNEKSCFDFDDDDDDNNLVHTAIGRKIPRVIPVVADKRKSVENDEANLPVAEDDENRMELIKNTRKENVVDNNNDDNKDDDFNTLLETTAVPDLPEVPDLLKSKSFPSPKAVKSPEKPATTTTTVNTEVATKLTNPKKRFVKSFEDFELMQNEQKKRIAAAAAAAATEQIKDKTATPTEKNEVIEEENNSSNNSSSSSSIVGKSIEISKLKCQIMSKISDDEIESPKYTPIKARSKLPKSKILENYIDRPRRSTAGKLRQIITAEDELVTSDSSKKSKANPKKSKYLKFDETSDVDEANETNEIVDEATKSEENLIIAEELQQKIDKVEEDSVEDEIDNNEIQIKCNENDESNITIKTNLSNLSNEEEMSALTTLATVSELKINIDKSVQPEIEKVVEDFVDKTILNEAELIQIDGNLTVVSEKDLADGQVEITADLSDTNKKPVTLTNFSMDFSECNDSSDSNIITGLQLNDLPDNCNKQDETKIVGDSKKDDPMKSVIAKKKDVCDMEDLIPQQVICAQVKETTTTEKVATNVKKVLLGNKSPKLLERLTENKNVANEQNIQIDSDIELHKKLSGPINPKSIKPATVNKNSVGQPSKPIILSEKVIKAEKNETGKVSVQKITSKRNMFDADEIDTFIIQKDATKLGVSGDESDEYDLYNRKKISEVKKAAASVASKRGKAKILQQTIITPAGDIIQPNSSTSTASTAVTDDSIFDINSMPIVLSDQILTAESLENMPIYLSEQTEPIVAKQTIIKKPVQQPQMKILNKSIPAATHLIQTPEKKFIKTKIVSTVGTKLLKSNTFTPTTSKQSKYVIVTQASSMPTSKYTVGKKQTIIKRSNETLAKIAPEPSSGNKIMIFTNQQGQQQRVLLTPAHQKLIGVQSKVKTFVKGNIIQKTSGTLTKEGQMIASSSGTSGLVTKSLTNTPKSSFILNSSQLTHTTNYHQNKTVKLDKTGKKIQIQSQRVSIKPPTQKTILIKNQHGQTVRKIQGTDDALLDQQVAEQLEAIKATSSLQQQQHKKPEILNFKSTPRTAIKRSYSKKPSATIETPKFVQKPLTSPVTTTTVAARATTPKVVTETTVPPLTLISEKKTEEPIPVQQEVKIDQTVKSTENDSKPTDRPLNQLVIQDAMGNQTTITEGQILALPSETVDGQPQSYMLVTLDESGNLTPLNNEALMSLDPNLGLSGDLGNTVLQIDQSGTATTQITTTTEEEDEVKNDTENVEVEKVEEPKVEVKNNDVITQQNFEQSQEQQQITSHTTVGGDPNQQLIVTGDPIATQKFLESLTEGTTDLANILANAEGGSILIQSDGQQILINTDSDNQMLLSVNTDNLNVGESTEGNGNPIFAHTQTPSKNQDILAAALADTDVFQQDQTNNQKILQSQLSPNSALYHPMNVGNVLETSLTLNSPIMTPLEVPSTNSKKITDEHDILNQVVVTKNVDLPITITDPNISHTVSQQQQQQQQQTIITNELQNNLELQLPISDSTISVTSQDSPNFVYSLPNLEESVDIDQAKPFNSSMPLLNDDENHAKDDKLKNIGKDVSNDEKASFLDETEGLCTLGGEMCSSLSEPPPDMFDLSEVLGPKSKNETKLNENGKDEMKIDEKSETSAKEQTSSATELSNQGTNSPSNSMNEEDSCEIPVQPEIVTDLSSSNEETFSMNKRNKRNGEDESEVDKKKSKFD